jgi:hypothetical protein
MIEICDTKYCDYFKNLYLLQKYTKLIGAIKMIAQGHTPMH